MNRRLNRASNLLLLFLGVFPQIYLLSESLDCTVDRSLPFWLAALCVFVWIAATYHRGLLIGMPLSALALYFAYLHYDANPSLQLVDLFDRITGIYYEHIYAPGSSYVFSSGVTSHSLVLVFLGFLLAAYLASALTSRVGRIPLALLGSLPVMGACLAVNGTPSSLIILPYVLFVVLLFVSGGSYWEESGFGKAFFVSLLPVTILLCALLLIYDPDRYQFNEQDVAISQRVDRISAALANWMGRQVEETDVQYKEIMLPDRDSSAELLPTYEPKTGWGELGGEMDLTQEFDFTVLGNTVLYATADTNSLLYLRMLSYGDYLGNAWAPAETPDRASSLPLTAYAIAAQSDAQMHSLSVRAEQPLPYQVLPYYAIAARGADSHVPADGQSDYTLSYASYTADITALQLPAEYREQELNYRDYAHTYYTRLPESTAEALRSICGEEGIEAGSPDVIWRVAAYVQNAGEYDILTEPYPSSDYALYFLTQGRQGYCIHFATAAAALYRSLGIPPV